MLLSIGIPNENIHHQKYEHNQQYMEWVKNVKADIALAIFTWWLDSRYFRTGWLFDQVRQQKNNIKIILIGDKKYENYQSHKTKKRNMIDTYIYTPYEPEQLKKIILESLQETPASETNASSSASDNRLNIRA